VSRRIRGRSGPAAALRRPASPPPADCITWRASTGQSMGGSPPRSSSPDSPAALDGASGPGNAGNSRKCQPARATRRRQEGIGGAAAAGVQRHVPIPDERLRPCPNFAGRTRTRRGGGLLGDDDRAGSHARLTKAADGHIAAPRIRAAGRLRVVMQQRVDLVFERVEPRGLRRPACSAAACWSGASAAPSAGQDPCSARSPCSTAPRRSATGLDRVLHAQRRPSSWLALLDR
jgi:hypothetical protein